VGRLHEATGRPVLTAAAAGKPAFEGYRGHGVFTSALIDALFHGDTNGDGLIELSDLAVHVKNTVPKISAEMSGRGIAEVLTQLEPADGALRLHGRRLSLGPTTAMMPAVGGRADQTHKCMNVALGS
jgi:hypothetical protein